MEDRKIPGREGRYPDRQKDVEVPAHISRRGWMDIVRRTKDEISKDQLSIVSAGVAFYLLMGIVPGLAALISIYGLAANPADIREQISALGGVIPQEVMEILQRQMGRISSESQTAGWGALIGIAVALWGGSRAVSAVMNGLNIAYGEREERGLIKFNLVAVGLMVVAVLAGLVAIGFVVILPVVLNFVGLGNVANAIVSALRWPLLFFLAIFGIGVFYRYGPSRRSPHWRWLSPGAVTATVLWLIGSGLFSLYVSYFGKYNETYGSLGAVVVLMMWLFVSSFAVLLGAELNAEAEAERGKEVRLGEGRRVGESAAETKEGQNH